MWVLTISLFSLARSLERFQQSLSSMRPTPLRLTSFSFSCQSLKPHRCQVCCTSHNNGTIKHTCIPIIKEVIILKFSDMIIAIASLAVIAVLILFPLTLVLTPALGNYTGYEISAVIAFILSPIIVGYIFTQKIWEENRTKTIAQITVLFTVLVVPIAIMEYTATDWAAAIRENYTAANPTATPSDFDWFMIETLALASEKFAVAVLILALTFIGLYIGSMLKKPAKS